MESPRSVSTALSGDSGTVLVGGAGNGNGDDVG